MEYVKDVLNYYFKYFLYLFVFTIVPALFLGLFFDPFGMYEFVFEYHNLTLLTFADFFSAVFQYTWWSILYFVIGLIIFVIFVSLMLGFIENHFRMGTVSLKSSFSLNNNVLGVFKTTIILFIQVFILNVIAMLLMYFVHFLGANNGVGSIFCNIFNYIVVLGLMVLYGRGFTLFGYATVETMLEGSPMLVGLGNGVRAMSAKSAQLFFIEVLTLGTCFVLMQIFTAINLPLIGNVLSCIIFIPMVCVNCMVLFFENNHLARKDKLKYYQRK